MTISLCTYERPRSAAHREPQGFSGRPVYFENIEDALRNAATKIQNSISKTVIVSLVGEPFALVLDCHSPRMLSEDIILTHVYSHPEGFDGLERFVYLVNNAVNGGVGHSEQVRTALAELLEQSRQQASASSLIS